MTLTGYILMTVLSKGALFDTPTLGMTQILLPSEAACTYAANKITRVIRDTETFCIPVYDDTKPKETQ